MVFSIKNDYSARIIVIFRIMSRKLITTSGYFAPLSYLTGKTVTDPES